MFYFFFSLKIKNFPLLPGKASPNELTEIHYDYGQDDLRYRFLPQLIYRFTATPIKRNAAF